MFATLPRELPLCGQAFRERVFSGDIYKLHCDGGTEPVRIARRWLEERCGAGPAELALRWRAADWSEVNEMQRDFGQDPELLQAVHHFAQKLDPEALIRIGSPRLRVVFPDGHLVPRAAPAYLPHRDTWFANSQSQINWWMPLLPVSEPMSFAFSPEYFDRPVANNSANFDYQRWMASGGFQRTRDKPREYPTTTEPLTPQRFSCEADEYICFAAAHLHQTMPVGGSRARISLDFRTVWSSDVEEQRGAPNVDNRSRGQATLDYCQSPFSGKNRP